MNDKQTMINALIDRRNALEDQLNEIATIEQLMLKYGFNIDEVLELDEQLTNDWADVCSSLYDLQREWMDEDNDIELYATEQDITI